MKFHFDCVFYYVTDLKRAVTFYSDILSLKLTSQDVVARFDIDGVLFELVPTADKIKLQGGGNARLCLKVDNIHQALDELQKKGIHTSQVQDVDNGMLASFKDPDGTFGNIDRKDADLGIPEIEDAKKRVAGLRQ